MQLVVKKFEELSLEELYEILQARSSVFVVEQNCPYQDMDGKDLHSYHVFLKDDTGIKAYVRVLDRGISYEEVSIGRVITLERGLGLGKQIMLAGIAVAKEKLKADKIKIGAQCYAKEFYEKVGFRQISDEYLEDGIPHMYMLLEI